MSDLIERLEGLTGPCRECDALIQEAIMRGRWQLGGAKFYTSSLNAAMTLSEGKRKRLIIAEDDITDCLVDGTQGCGATPAIALCIAALKAKS